MAEPLLVYRNAPSRGIRNIGVSAIIAGLVVAMVGAVASIANSFIIGMVGVAGMTQDAIMDILMDFMKNILDSLAWGFILIAVVYFVGAVVCLILSARRNNIKKV
ncbi:MAG: hypothetical protein E7290_11440 [Lachnospiraceae bacterium]|nr:hypothetical protein [Lachnospiraceae bacterium]